jgi:hypothetical protein
MLLCVENPSERQDGPEERNPIFTAVPGENSPFQLRSDYQKQLLDSLRIYLRKIETTFTIRACSLSEKLESLDPLKRFSPAIFSAYVHIKEGYAKKDAHLIFDMLQMLKNLKNEELYADEFRCSSILTESWEYPLLSYLRDGGPRDEMGRAIGPEVRILPLIHLDDDAFPPHLLAKSLELIREYDPDLGREVDCYVSSIKLFSGKVMEGVTSPRFF